ncbi:MAG: Gfo/Idh/MocA family protein [Promethearchaeota archaeon]
MEENKRKNRSKVKMSIVGCGMIADHLMTAKKLFKLRDIDFCSCVDTNEDRLLEFSRKNKIHDHYTNFDEMLENDEVDAVYLAVPHFLHKDLVTKTIRAGKHIFCEKPIATTVKDGIEMARMADEHGIKLGINYQYRYDKGLYAMAQTVRRGRMGELYYSTISVPWNRPESYFEKSPWHKKWESSGGGTLITHASHAIDIMAWAMGKPRTISGEYNTKKFRNIGLEVEDNGIGIVKFESGAIATILSSQASSPSSPHVNMTFQGERGRIECKYILTLYAKVKYKNIKKVKEKPPASSTLALIGSFRGFARWLLEDVPYLTTGWEALKALFIVKSIYESARSGNKIHCSNLEWWNE